MRYSGMSTRSVRPDPVSVSTYATNGIRQIRRPPGWKSARAAASRRSHFGRVARLGGCGVPQGEGALVDPPLGAGGGAVREGVERGPAGVLAVVQLGVLPLTGALLAVAGSASGAVPGLTYVNATTAYNSSVYKSVT